MISVGGGSLDELLALVDVTFANLVFVGLDREHLVAQSALIEGALEAADVGGGGLGRRHG